MALVVVEARWKLVTTVIMKTMTRLEWGRGLILQGKKSTVKRETTLQYIQYSTVLYVDVTFV
jgi:hypothetical protein